SFTNSNNDSDNMTKNNDEEPVRYITNIEHIDVPENADEETRLAIYKENCDDYIVRRHNQITSNEVSSGVIRDYYYPTKNAKNVGGDYYYYDDENSDLDYNGWTQESYADNLLPLGGWYYDNYGRYIFNFGNSDPIIFYNFDKYTPEGELIRQGSVPSTVETDDGEQDYYRIEFSPDYETTNGNTYDITVFISPKESVIEKKSSAFIAQIETVKRTRILLCIFGLVEFLCAFYLIIVCGYKKPAEEGGKCWSKTPFLGKIYTEVYLCAMIFALLFASILVGVFCQNGLSNLIGNVCAENIIITVSMSVLFAVGMISLLQVITKIKTRSFFADCILLKAFKKFKAFVTEKVKKSRLFKLYNARPAGEKISIRSYIFVVILSVLGIIAFFEWLSYNDEVAVIIGFIGLVTALLGEIKTIKTSNEVDKLSDKINNLANNENVSEEVSEDSIFYSELTKLDQISDTIKNSVEQQIKSERMKIELVANVSHDLKTPLTSIISYIDLLKKSDLSDEAEAYVKILDKKSQKLKSIVSDVFSLAKATSGVEINLEKIDFIMLFNQVLADNDDKIKESGKLVKVNIAQSYAMIMGDGNKLYRVFQNLLDNMLNYSMNGTRLFMDIRQEGENIVFAAKNVSAEPMDFTAEEISERFVRGDKSRTDGGSGLGLSIAKSFTEACGGTFNIEIDGDLFKTTVTMPLLKEDTDEEKTSEQE
ncbi:MAG: sensor histidine kinase, partial [Hominimerdicola sp.]